MNVYHAVQQDLRVNPKRWLVTGVAGFIGSNLLEALLMLDQTVVGLDNFATGFRKNLERVERLVTPEQWDRFRFHEGDICDLASCHQAVSGVDYVLHEAALGSVPRSLDNPIHTNETNISGFLNMLTASRDAKVKRFVYASSSAAYGDHPGLPKVEDIIGRPLSPYAVTKYVNELYADVFGRCYGLESIGLRYFNVFGPRQNPDGAYVAVIPKWFSGILRGEPIYIYGDGETSRDFCYVQNVVQANILAAYVREPNATGQIYNVAYSDRTSLNLLFERIKAQIAKRGFDTAAVAPIYRDFRRGDGRHSLADIAKAKALLGYSPAYSVQDGLEHAADWYVENVAVGSSV